MSSAQNPLRDRIERHSTLINVAMVAIAVVLFIVLRAAGLPTWLAAVLGVVLSAPGAGLLVAALTIGGSFVGASTRDDADDSGDANEGDGRDD